MGLRELTSNVSITTEPFAPVTVSRSSSGAFGAARVPRALLPADSWHGIAAVVRPLTRLRAAGLPSRMNDVQAWPGLAEKACTWRADYLSRSQDRHAAP